MMTMDEITKQVRMCRQGAAKMLHKAGVKKLSVPFAHGRKHYYRITPERLLEIRAEQQKDPVKIALQQATALSQIESVFLNRMETKR